MAALALGVLLVLVQAWRPEVLGPAGREHLQQLASSGRFRHWDLIGSAAFAIYGFLTALRRRYDLWGSFVLTLLPTVGGGVIRDLLIGGERFPLLLFRDPTYLALVLSVLVFGSLGSPWLVSRDLQAGWPARLLVLADSIGLASFAVIGARVALLADLPWYWLPFSAAVSCTGGGCLMDIVTGREPRTFQGEPYEEIAVLGSLLLVVLWCAADGLQPATWPITAAMPLAWTAMLLARLWVVQRGWRSWRPGS
ncbi:MAG: TRIC cation channel family protein [Cyanobium sp. M30B3]|nr:MAG: TRIC cation channel family protein [Cyanobium sp. M30B3]